MFSSVGSWKSVKCCFFVSVSQMNCLLQECLLRQKLTFTCVQIVMGKFYWWSEFICFDFPPSTFSTSKAAFLFKQYLREDKFHICNPLWNSCQPRNPWSAGSGSGLVWEESKVSTRLVCIMVPTFFWLFGRQVFICLEFYFPQINLVLVFKLP